MTDRNLCLSCVHCVGLNYHHLIDGEVFRTCDMGEVPTNCDVRRYESNKQLKGSGRDKKREVDS